MARRDRRARGAGAVEAQPNIFSKIVPDVIEDPATAALGGAVGFGGNLLGDVKDAVVGIPMGLVTLAKDPIAASRAIAGSTWHTWSPLFRGDVVKFAKQTYDHPLAPLLDVAAVFTLGAGAAARGAGALEKAGSTSSTVSKVASLRKGKAVDLFDPKGERPPVQKIMSRRAGRRLVQEGVMRMDASGHLPQFYTRLRYERARLGDMAHRHVVAQFLRGEALQKGRQIELNTEDEYNAVFTQAHTALQAAELVEDITEQGKRARSATMGELHANLIRHNDAFTPEEAANYVRKGHYRYIVAPEYMDRKAHTALSKTERRLRAKEHKWTAKRGRLEAEHAAQDAIRAKYAEEAAAGERIVAELADANREIQRMREAGYDVAGGARTVHGSKLIDTPNVKQRMRYESEALQEATDRVARLEAMREQSLKAKVKHDEALTRMEKLRDQITQNENQLKVEGSDFIDMRERASQGYYAFAGDSYDSFVQAVDKFGQNALTKNPDRALKTADGKVYIAPKHDAYNLSLEGGNSLRFLHKLLHKPTMVWKTAVIGYSPRTVVNNAVGNWFMYAARDLPSINGVRALKDALEFRFGKGVTDDPLFKSDHWLHRYFSDELADQFAVGNELLKLGEEAFTPKAKIKQALRQGFYPIVHETSERPVRVAAIYKALRDMPEVRAEIARFKARGVPGDKATERGIARALAKNPVLRDEAALHSRRIAGDYVTLSEPEKWARDIIPFYLWNRHILKTTGNMLLDTPGRLAFGARLSELGIEETEGLLGEIPDFLRGAIPLAAIGLGDKTSRANVLLTASLNPYATVGELAESLNAFTTGEGRRGAALSQFNPFVVGAAESVFETSLLTGTHSPREGGVISDVLSRMALQLPQVKLLEAAATGDTELTPKGNEYLYARDDRSPLSSFLGVPLRNVSLERAATLVAEANPTENTGRSRKRRSRSRA